MLGCCLGLTGTHCTGHSGERSGTQTSVKVLLNDGLTAHIILTCTSDQTREHYAFSESTGNGLTLYFDGLRGDVLNVQLHLGFSFKGHP